MEYFKEELYYDDARLLRESQYEASLESIRKNEQILGRSSAQGMRRSRQKPYTMTISPDESIVKV